ncbi:hypothetical protein AB0D29_13950 [Streptomyces sp. NPDC048424]|uniref:hypothetical protein n=1 Tax=Streptomyces sp. NPDC048424 TaxID=3155265 RepID=UPI00342F7EE2
MNEIPTRTGTLPARHRRDRWILGGITVGVIIAVGSFMAGRASVDSPDCAGAKRVAAESRRAILEAAQKDTPADKSRGREPLQHYGYVVLENPNCSSSSERDDPQAGLDALNSGK